MCEQVLARGVITLAGVIVHVATRAHEIHKQSGTCVFKSTAMRLQIGIEGVFSAHISAPCSSVCLEPARLKASCVLLLRWVVTAPALVWAATAQVARRRYTGLSVGHTSQHACSWI